MKSLKIIKGLRKNSKKIICIILSITILSTCLPMSALANELTNSLLNANLCVVENSLSAQILEEDETMRTQYTKYFLLSDGTYQATTYSTPIHYEDENGQWIDIDNTLDAQMSGEETIYLAENGNTILSFPESLNEGSATTIAKNDFEISFSLDMEGLDGYDGGIIEFKTEETLSSNLIKEQIEENILEVDGLETVDDLDLSTNESALTESQFDLAEKEILEMNEDITTLTNLTSAIEYTNALPSTDIEYIITSTYVKESIIVNEMQDSHVYIFDFDFGDLEFEINDDSSITFYEDCEHIIPVFNIAAPYAYDSNGVFDYNVTQELIEIDGEWKLIISADEDWMNSEERSYPVVIDPTIVYEMVNECLVSDTYVTNYWLYTGDNSSKTSMTVGYREDLDTWARSYIRVELPDIPENSTIINAQITYAAKNINGESLSVNAYQVPDSWVSTNSANYTWSNQPFDSTKNSYIDELLLDSRYISDEIYYTFDITTALKNSYQNGYDTTEIMLASLDETIDYSAYIDFHTTDTYYDGEGILFFTDDYRPLYTVVYAYSSGFETELLTYEQFDAGRAGIAYVGDYHRNLVVARSELSLGDINISRLNYSNWSDIGISGDLQEYDYPYGENWQLNFSQSISAVEDKYVYINSSGQEIEFEYSGEDTDSMQIWSLSSAMLTLSEYTLYIPIGNSNLEEVILESSQGYSFFNSNGYLCKFTYEIDDAEGIEIEYVNSTPLISKITDSEGKNVVFNYSDGKLVSMISKNADNESIKYDNETPYEYIYEYEGGYLTNVLYPDGELVSYEFSDDIVILTDVDDYNVRISLNSGFVTKIQEYAGSVAGNFIEVSTNEVAQRVLTDNYGNKLIKQFNSLGQTILTLDQDGNYIAQTYDTMGTTIALNSNSFMGINLLTNHSAEYDGSWSISSSGVYKTSDINLSNETTSYAGLNSFSIKNDTTTTDEGSKTIYQDIAKDLFEGAEELTMTARLLIDDELISQVDDVTYYGAVIFLEFLDVNGNKLITSTSNYETSTSDQWSYLTITQEIPESAESVKVGLQLENANGIVYFDAIQLVTGDLSTSYNYVEDADFNSLDEVTFSSDISYPYEFSANILELNQSLYSHSGESPNSYTATENLVEAEAEYKIAQTTNKVVIMEYDGLKDAVEEYATENYPQWHSYDYTMSLFMEIDVYNNTATTAGKNKLWTSLDVGSWTQLLYVDNGSYGNGSYDISWLEFAEFTNEDEDPSLFVRTEAMRDGGGQIYSRITSYEPNNEANYVTFNGEITIDSAQSSTVSNADSSRDNELNDSALQVVADIQSSLTSVISVPIGGSEEDQYLVGFWVKPSGMVPDDTERVSNVTIEYDGNIIGEIDFDSTNPSWQYVQTIVTIPCDMPVMDICINLDYQTGCAYFDGLQVQLYSKASTSVDSTESDYTDTEVDDEIENNLSTAIGISTQGNITGTRITNGTQSVYVVNTYDENGNLSSQLNTNGSTTTYEFYDDTGLLQSSTSGLYEGEFDTGINLLSNGGFEYSVYDQVDGEYVEDEQSANYWSNYSKTTSNVTLVRNDSQSYSGDYSYQLTNSSNNISYIEQEYNGVVPGEEYKLSAWLNLPSNLSGSNYAYLSVEILDADKELISEYTVNGDYINSTSDWTNESIDFVMPQDGKFVNVKVILNGIGTIYVDDVVLEAVLSQEQVFELAATSAIEYSYNAMGVLNSISQIVDGLSDGDEFENSYEYSGDKLTTVSHNGLEYEFVYDIWGNLADFKVNDDVLLSYDYDEENYYQMNSLTFANGDVISYEYDDELGLITAIYYNNSSTPSYEFVYKSDSSLNEIIDNVNGTITKNTTDGFEILNSIDNSVILAYNDNIITFYDQNYEFEVNELEDYDSLSQEEKDLRDYQDDLGIYSYSYSVSGNTDYTSSNTYDYFGRILNEVIDFDTATLTQEFEYVDLSDWITTYQIESLYNNLNGNEISAFSYAYDSNGNIVEIIDETSGVITSYTYDQAGQLISETVNGETTSYTYDTAGNIVSKTLPDSSVINYTYDSDWTDQLIGYGDKIITYDEIGNPINYLGNTLSWSGKQLESYNENTYTYNSDGLRTSKTVDGVTTDFIWNSDTLVGQTDGENTLYFLYESSEVIGFVHNGVDTYFYVKNLQGDVIQIVDEDSNIVAEYTYNAWGEVLTSTGEMAEINPIRYRSYYYDSEIGLYYCQQRYYNPEIGRWLSIDVLFDNNHFNGANLYVYCFNNPIMYVDYTGLSVIDDLLAIESVSDVYWRNYNNNLYLGEAMASAYGALAIAFYIPLGYLNQAVNFDRYSLENGVWDSNSILEDSFIEFQSWIDKFPEIFGDIDAFTLMANFISDENTNQIMQSVFYQLQESLLTFFDIDIEKEIILVGVATIDWEDFLIPLLYKYGGTIGAKLAPGIGYVLIGIEVAGFVWRSPALFDAFELGSILSFFDYNPLTN